MTAEERALFEALLERVELEVQGIARGHEALAGGLELIEIVLDRLESRLDHLERQVDTLDARLDAFDARLDALGACSAGTWQALERMARHLGLCEAPHPPKRAPRGGSKRRKTIRAAGDPSHTRRRARSI